jgi:hypothetical protein
MDMIGDAPRGALEFSADIHASATAVSLCALSVDPARLRAMDSRLLLAEWLDAAS